ncbi:hypothetical protein M404DRAFT_1008944, partial [Pisolithus tinctorius Marx 270]
MAIFKFLRQFKGHDNIVRLCDFEINFHSNGVLTKSISCLRNHACRIIELTGLPSQPTLSTIPDAELHNHALSLGSVTCIPLAERVRNVDPRLLDLLSEVFSLDVDSTITCKDALSHKYLDDVRCDADGFVCFPMLCAQYKGNLDEDQHDDTMEILLPVLDFGIGVAARPSIPPSPIPPLKDVGSGTHTACSPSVVPAAIVCSRCDCFHNVLRLAFTLVAFCRTPFTNTTLAGRDGSFGES